MTTQEIINRLCIIKRDWPGTSIDIDRLLLTELEAQLRIEQAARKGSVNATKTIAKILKSLEKDPRVSMRYPWIDSAGRQCICDGYRAFRLNNHLPLIERPDDAGKPIDLDRVFPDTAGWKSLTMPNAKELREYIALERAKWTGKRSQFAALWDFGEHEPSVNAMYLLDAAQVFPDATEILWNTLVSPMVIRCDDGDAVILPVRTTKTQLPPKNDAEQAAIDNEKARNKANNEAAVAEYKEREERRNHVRAMREQWHNTASGVVAAKSTLDAAKNDEDRETAKAMLIAACRCEAKARLAYYGAKLENDETNFIEPEELEDIVKKLYAVA